MPTSLPFSPSAARSGWLALGTCSRREMLCRGAAGLALAVTAPWNRVLPAAEVRVKSAPSQPVAIQRCPTYEPVELTAKLNRAVDLIGGIGDLVRHKTVTVKLNLTGNPRETLGGLPAYRTFQVHPNFVAATCAALDRASARRIVLVESSQNRRPLDEGMATAGWDIEAINAAGGHKVSWEDTRHQGAWPGYSRLGVSWGGYVYEAFDVNSRYANTDVLISLAKLKQHNIAGITLTVKNLFGMAPSSIYGNNNDGDASIVDERSTGGRWNTLHLGSRPVPAGVPAEINPESSRRPTVRVPRVTADLFGLRPVDLCLIDGIETIRGGAGLWSDHVSPVRPHILFAGRNGVCTDAIGCAAMGFDPEAPTGMHPFQGLNHLALLARLGVGTNVVEQIEVLGSTIEEAIYPFDRLRIRSVAGRGELSWGEGVLQEAEDPHEDWFNVPGATSPHRVGWSDEKRFFRVIP